MRPTTRSRSETSFNKARSLSLAPATQQICDCRQSGFDFAALYARTQQPRAQQSSAHSGHSLVDHLQQRAATATRERFDQLEIANRNAVEHEMILRLEVNEIRNVSGCGALSVSRVTQTRARRANRFFFATQTITIERAHFEVIEKQRRAIVFLPLPVVEASAASKPYSSVERPVGTILPRQRRCLHLLPVRLL